MDIDNVGFGHYTETKLIQTTSVYKKKTFCNYRTFVFDVVNCGSIYEFYLLAPIVAALTTF